MSKKVIFKGIVTFCYCDILWKTYFVLFPQNLLILFVSVHLKLLCNFECTGQYLNNKENDLNVFNFQLFIVLKEKFEDT